MALVFGNNIRSCLRSYSQMIICLDFKRLASRNTPVQKTFSKYDDIRMDKFLKRTHDLIAGNNTRKKKSNKNGVESILNCLQDGGEEQLKDKKSIIINKLPKEPNTRMKKIGDICYHNLTALFQSREICDNLTDLGFEMTDIMITSRLSMVIVSWQLADPANEKKVLDLLPVSSSAIRHALGGMRILGHIPPVLFYRDTSTGKQTELEHLFNIADMGSDEDRLGSDDLIDDTEIDKDCEDSVNSTKVYADIYGINHDKLKMEVLNAKKRVPGKIYVESAVDKKIVEIGVKKA